MEKQMNSLLSIEKESISSLYKEERHSLPSIDKESLSYGGEREREREKERERERERNSLLSIEKDCEGKRVLQSLLKRRESLSTFQKRGYSPL